MLGNKELRKKISGAQARRNGQVFEELVLYRAHKEGITALKIPDGCKRINGPRGLKLIPVKNPFDFIAFYEGFAITFDAKTTNESYFMHSQIDPQQVKSLDLCAKNVILSGYLIWFRKQDLVSFITVKKLKEVQRRSSVVPDDGIIIGNGSHFSIFQLFDLKELNAHLINRN